MAEVGKEVAGLGLLGEVSQWPLKRYGRFMLSGTEELPEPSLEAATATATAHTWKVFESSEEAGQLVLTIVISGHFFISQGQTLLNKSRMFRVQFSGEHKEKALEHCCSCVQTLAQYITVEAPDSVTQELQQTPGPLLAGESQGKDRSGTDPQQQQPHLNLEQQVCVTTSTGALEGRISVMQLAQTFLASEELPHIYEQSSWGSEELGPFLRLCLMDQNFPAFVEEVEKELKKLIGLRN
ncbi:meiotic recombination protein REC114 isoform X2 [Nannospalax galili]|uniref:meiotic recombination protein REC114 isoform X2 n=1 Tax=Nannospalax galili TaxID=1026970 RepID=UPI00111C0213|nr:meiotic recombination protein REC114 isoform X2 [Nannospalax galili]